MKGDVLPPAPSQSTKEEPSLEGSWGGAGVLGASCPHITTLVASLGPHCSCPVLPPPITSNTNRPLKFFFWSERQPLTHLWHRCVLLSGSVCKAIWGWDCFLGKYDKLENPVIKNSTGNILLQISKLNFKSCWWSNYSLQSKCKLFKELTAWKGPSLFCITHNSLFNTRTLFINHYTRNFVPYRTYLYKSKKVQTQVLHFLIAWELRIRYH